MTLARAAVAAAVTVALFVGLPVWEQARADDGQWTTCKPGADCPALAEPVLVSLLTFLGGEASELRATPLTYASASACLAAGIAAGWAWPRSAASRARAAAWMRPTRGKLALAAIGWATLPHVVVSFLLFTRRLEWMGRAQFVLHAGTKVLSLLVLPLSYAQSLLQDALLRATLAYAAFSRASFLAAAEGGSHPAYLRPGGAVFVVLASAAVWYLLACLAAPRIGRLVSQARARRARASAPPGEGPGA